MEVGKAGIELGTLAAASPSGGGQESRKKYSENDYQHAIYIAGNLIGLASRLDADALEEFLTFKPADFIQAQTCLAAIKFRRQVDDLISGNLSTSQPLNLSTNSGGHR
jgi:hypothetical protein